MIANGTPVTWRDPLTKEIVGCIVTQTVTMWAGTQRRGTAYSVYADGRGHWTARKVRIA